MYRLKLKGGAFVLSMQKNGRDLFPVKKFTQKPSAITNIRAVLKACNGKFVLLQDDSFKTSDPIVYKVTSNKLIATNIKPKK